MRASGQLDHGLEVPPGEAALAADSIAGFRADGGKHMLKLLAGAHRRRPGTIIKWRAGAIWAHGTV